MKRQGKCHLVPLQLGTCVSGNIAVCPRTLKWLQIKFVSEASLQICNLWMRSTILYCGLIKLLIGGAEKQRIWHGRLCSILFKGLKFVFKAAVSFYSLHYTTPTSLSGHPQGALHVQDFTRTDETFSQVFCRFPVLFRCTFPSRCFLHPTETC